MESTMLFQEDQNKKKGLIVSIIVHLLLLLLCLIPSLTAEQENEPISGILVALGTPEGGTSNIAPESQETVEDTDVVNPTEDNSSNSQEETSTSKSPEKTTSPPEETEPIKEDITPLTDESVIAADKSRKQAEDAQKQAEEDEKARKLAEQQAREEAARKAEEEAQKKQEQYDQSKKKFGDLLSSGLGNGGQQGNQGNPDGDPDSKVLDNLATGSGRIGEGLTDREVVYEPSIQDASQKTGKVVVKVCVNSAGDVIEANYTQRNSTTTDKYLIDKAEKAAKQYKFSPSNISTQCGNITINFQVQ